MQARRTWTYKALGSRAMMKPGIGVDYRWWSWWVVETAIERCSIHDGVIDVR